MNFKSLLAVASVATVAQASAFEWQPANLYPNPSVDVSSTYFLENLNFNCYVEGVAITDVMPAWVDEDGNEIKAVSGQQNPWGFDPSAFVYQFDAADFKANGEYTLLFPEGLLVNAAGEKSDKIETPYTLDIPELAPPMFEDFKILSITPDLNEPQAVWNDQVIKINTNHNEAIGLVTMQISDDLTGESVTFSSSFSSGRVLGDASEISWEVMGSFKFYEDHSYKVDFVFYNGADEVNELGEPTKIVDRVTYHFKGRVEAYKYSSLELLSVEPAPMSIVISEPSQAVFTYTFSGPVTVYQAETPLGQNGKNVYPPSCLSSNEDKTVWTLDLSENDYVKTIDALLTIYIYAKDMDGYQLQGNWGEEGESCFVNDWQCDLGAFPVVVAQPAIGESIDRLSEIVVKAENGEPMSWSWMGQIKVINQLGDVLGTLVYDQPEGDDVDAAMAEIRFTRWMDDFWNVSDIDLVKEGYYAIQIEPGTFLMGDQFESKQSRSLYSTFVVTGALDEPEGPGVDPAEQEKFYFDKVAPADGSVVGEIRLIQLWYPDMVACEEFKAMVYNTADNSLVTTGTGLFDWDDILLINIEFSTPVVEAGVYEVVIPARSIGDDAFFSSGGASGICNPEIKLTYTVDPSGNAVEAVGAVAEADVYDLHGRLVVRGASAADVKMLPKGVYVVGGRKLVVK